MNSINVYWAYNTMEHRQSHAMLMNEMFYPLNRHLRINKKLKSHFLVCPAIRSITDNTYVVNFPIDFDLHFDALGKLEDGQMAWFIERESSYDNRIQFDLDFSWYFFCEEPLALRILPPIYHVNNVQQYGMFASGEFDIGSWFRPITPSYILWDNQKQFKAQKGEPAFYLEFKTNKKINFVQFETTDKINNIALACVEQGNHIPLLPLISKYKSFKNSQLAKVLLKEIKENLITNV